MMTGIAHRQGNIQLDQNLNYFFGDEYPMATFMLKDKRLITAEAVLQQRHGIEWDEWTLDYRDPDNVSYQMIVSNDWYQLVLMQPTEALPGEKFAYSTGVSNLMGGMIRKLSGLSPRNFAMQELFGPLGIEDIHWEGYSENGRGNGMTQWPNPDNDEPLGYALWLKPGDMIKFGEFLEGDAVERSDWGTGHFSVVDCNHMKFEIESEEITTLAPLERLTGSCDIPRRQVFESRHLLP